MQTAQIIRNLAASVLIALLMTHCGGGGSSMGSQRQLTSITVLPSNGDAIAPNGTLPFTATGNFNQPPTTQANMSVQWTSSSTSVATIDANSGVATCLRPGGPLTITASASTNGSVVTGSAALNCLGGPPIDLGRCQLVNGTLTGMCLGVRSGVCHQSFDPSHCPQGQPPMSQEQFSCGSSGNITVDGTRACVP